MVAQKSRAEVLIIDADGEAFGNQCSAKWRNRIPVGHEDRFFRQQSWWSAKYGDGRMTGYGRFTACGTGAGWWTARNRNYLSVDSIDYNKDIK